MRLSMPVSRCGSVAIFLVSAHTKCLQATCKLQFFIQPQLPRPSALNQSRLRCPSLSPAEEELQVRARSREHHHHLQLLIQPQLPLTLNQSRLRCPNYLQCSGIRRSPYRCPHEGPLVWIHIAAAIPVPLGHAAREADIL